MRNRRSALVTVGLLVTAAAGGPAQAVAAVDRAPGGSDQRTAALVSEDGVDVGSDGTARVLAGYEARKGISFGIERIGDRTSVVPGGLVRPGPVGESRSGGTDPGPGSTAQEGEHYEVKVTFLDRSGKPTTEGSVDVVGVSQKFSGVILGSDPTIRLPKGEYYLRAEQYFENPAGEYRTYDPDLVVDRDRTVVVDPRAARPLTITVPDSKVRQHSVYYGAARIGIAGNPTQEYIGGLYTTSLAGHHLGPIGDGMAPAATSVISTQWAEPGATGRFEDSPTTYDTLNVTPGKVVAGIERRVRPGELARVRTTYFGQGGISPNHVLPIAHTANGARLSAVVSSNVLTKLPQTVTHFLEPRPMRWQMLFQQGEWGTDGKFEDTRSYRPNQLSVARWGTAVLAPGFGSRGDLAKRTGSSLSVTIPLLTSADGQLGTSPADTAATKLFRDGRLLAESGEAGQVHAKDAGTGRFVLETSQRRPALTPLSQQIEARWEFTSRPGDTVLPLWTVRYRPTVDGTNTATRQPVTRLPFRLMAQPGSAPGRTELPTVEISGDGKTWTRATVRPSADGYVAEFPTPAGTSVSLRTSMRDSTGNAHHQTITNAYALR